jgi:hypothetical protein
MLVSKGVECVKVVRVSALPPSCKYIVIHSHDEVIIAVNDSLSDAETVECLEKANKMIKM